MSKQNNHKIPVDNLELFKGCKFNYTPIPVVEKIQSLVCIPENSDTNWYKYYDYCENINDGRGYTVGLVGFCSGTYDLVKVLQKLPSNHYLRKYIELIKKVDGTDSTIGLENFPNDLKLYNDDYWKKSTWDSIIELYWNPAYEYCKSKNLVTFLSQYIVYDTVLNFGELKTFKNLNIAKNIEDEKIILKQFLQLKQNKIVKDPTLGESKNNRVDMQLKLLSENNMWLDIKATLYCYGDSFII